MVTARVFPRKTAASPDDDLAFFGPPPMLILPEVDEVHISVAFTWDMPIAEWLYDQWSIVGVPIKMGGPAFNEPGGEFFPGMYLKRGYTITSRGCPNRCWFCAVPKREGHGIRELEIKDGWNILDDNLLACSEDHIRSVFEMLKRQPHRPLFTGGLEAKILKPWHADLIREAKTERLYMAYDTPDDLEPLREAGKIMRESGITAASHTAGCYCLIGYRGDTFDKAVKRLKETVEAGFVPYAMLYRDEKGEANSEWRKFQREWCRPQIVTAKLKEVHNDALTND